MPWRWRPDGDFVDNLSLTRKIMPFIMRTRAGSTVYFEHKVEIARSLSFLSAFRERTGLHATVLHLLIWAVTQTLDARPRLNRFVVGTRVFQRRGIWVSFSGKKKKDDSSPIVVVKKEIQPSWSFETLVREIEGGIQEGRSDRASTSDKELRVLLKLPHFLLGILVRLQLWLDGLGLLPAFLYREDPLYASVFIANLGSLQMDAGFHHLYEYGNIPIFIVMGKIQDEVRVNEKKEIEIKPTLTLRYSFDERIEDGLYCLKALKLLQERMEDPEKFQQEPISPASAST